MKTRFSYRLEQKIYRISYFLRIFLFLLIFSEKTNLIIKREVQLPFCIQRFKQNSELGSIDQISPSKSQEIESWRHRTKSGDLTEIMDSENQKDLEPLVSSTAENCLGSDCDFYNECYLYKAREINQNLTSLS